MSRRTLTVGLYGINGHQVHDVLLSHPQVVLGATAGMTVGTLPKSLQEARDVCHYNTLGDLLANDEIQLISLCSPNRRDQAKEAVRCLEAGKHVYAEKPCAMTERELDEIIGTARAVNRKFHEMAGTAFEQPYLEMRRLVKAGTIGTVVQVLVQKSYPYADWRPEDEDVDGGLLMQVGVHALRLVEHVAGVSVKNVEARQTKLGNPRKDNLRMAVSMVMELENGALASAVANYLNPPAFGSWGNETLRIFGTKGFVEAVDGGRRTRLVLNERDCGPLKVTEPSQDYFIRFLSSLLGDSEMPLDLEEELHPTRMVIRAKAKIASH